MKTIIFTSVILFWGSTYLTAQSTNIWQGTLDQNFSTAANWSLGAVPSATDSIIVDIPNDTVVFDMDVTIDNLIVQNGAKIDFSDANVIIKGNLDNQSGSVYQGLGTITFQGIQAQTLKGNNSFTNMIIDNSSGVTIVSDESAVSGLLSVSQGILYVNDNLTINTTGSIGPLGTGYGTIQGNVRIEKSFSVAPGGWRFLSSPMNNTQFSQLADDILTAGFPGSTLPSNPFVSVYTYDETVGGTGGYGYTAPSNVTDTIGVGKGVMIYMEPANFTSGTIDFEGELNNGDVNLPVFYTNSGDEGDGWNFVGNPFAATIDWDDASISKVNLNDAVYVWSATNGNYAAYIDGISTNGGSNLISSCQGFWVKANSSNPAITIAQEAKTTAPSTFIKTGGTSDYLSIVVDNGAVTDETAIRANANASIMFESQYDALKFQPNNGLNPTVFTSFAGQSDIYSINQFNNQETEILLSVLTGSSGIHTLSFTGVDYFSENQCIFLEDLFLGNTYQLTEGFTLNVGLSDTTTVPRFKIILGAPLYVGGYDITCHGSNDGHINVAKNSNYLFDVSWMDAFGNILSVDQGVYQIATLENLSAGNYYVETTDALCGQTITEVIISEPAEVIAAFELSADTVYIGGQLEVQLTNQSSNAVNFVWQLGAFGTTTQANTIITFDHEGVFPIMLYAYQSNTCYDVTGKEVVVVSDLAGILEKTDQLVDINILNNELIVKGQSGDTELIISNISGQVLLRQNVSNDYDQINISQIPSQVILVTIVAENGATTRKFSF